MSLSFCMYFSIILVQHLREKGRESGLAGVATVSSSWDAHVTLLETLERPLNWLFYNRHFTKLLVKYIDKYGCDMHYDNSLH